MLVHPPFFSEIQIYLEEGRIEKKHTKTKQRYAEVKHEIFQITIANNKKSVLISTTQNQIPYCM